MYTPKPRSGSSKVQQKPQTHRRGLACALLGSSGGLRPSESLNSRRRINRASTSRTLTFQRLLAILVALLDFGDGVQVLAFTILVLDIGGDFPFVVAQQAKGLHNGRVALAEGQVIAVVLLAVFDVQGDDLLMVLTNIGNGITAGATKWPMSRLTPM